MNKEIGILLHTWLLLVEILQPMQIYYLFTRLNSVIYKAERKALKHEFGKMHVCYSEGKKKRKAGITFTLETHRT
jgi:hypothetical protein